MSCVEYLRWQLCCCNGRGWKPEHGPKPYTGALGTRREVSLFLCLRCSLSHSCRTICKVTHQQNDKKQTYKNIKTCKGFFPFQFFWPFISLFAPAKHFYIDRYSFRVPAHQKSASQKSFYLQDSSQCVLFREKPATPASLGIETHRALLVIVIFVTCC